MAELKFNVGDSVDLARWDRSEAQAKKLGICVVRTVERTPFCESGWMITVEGSDGRVDRLDQNWIDCV